MESYGIELPSQSIMAIGIVVVLYVSVITLFGGYFARFNHSINDFFYSGQRFSWWLPAASMVATGIGSYSFLKYSEQGFNTGMSSSMTYTNDWFALPFFIFGWLPIIYFSRVKSIPEYFERRFNRTARMISLTIILAYMFFYIGYNLYTIGVAAEGLLGIPQKYSVPLVGTFLGLYVTFGGQTAVIFTDLFQGVTLYIAGAIALFMGITALGGLDSFWGYLPISHRLPFVHLTENPKFNTAGLFWGEALAGSIAFAFMNQGFIMRYLTIKSVNDGRKAAVFNLLITMPTSAIIVGGIGWIGKSLVTQQMALGGALSGYEFVSIGDTFHTFLIVCWTVVKQNPWIFGFIIAALMAALMSTVDTLINACAAIMIYDIYKPFIKKEASDSHYLKTARWASVLATVLGLLLVVAFNLQKDSSVSLMSLHYKGIMVIIPSIVTTIFLGAFWKKFHAKAACISMAFGSLFTIVTIWIPELIEPVSYFVSGPQNGQFIYMRALFGMSLTALIGVICTFILPGDTETESGLTISELDIAKKKYKGSDTLNETKGERVRNITITLDDSIEKNKIHVPSKHMEKLKAQDGDLIYISDNRLYLGGLRSGHVKAYSLKGNGINDTLLMSTSTLNECYLLKDRHILLEKIF